MKKIICIDYDGTYTDFPEVLDVLILKAKQMGHSVILATMRYEHEVDSGIRSLENKVDKIYFTGRKAKKPFLNALRIFPSIWIDDRPDFILNDSL